MDKTPKSYQDYVVFVESKSLRGRSKTEYLRQVRKIATHYAGRELGRIKEREVFDYLIHLRDVQKLRPSTLNQALVALRMFFRDCAGLKWVLWEQFTIRRDQPLPVVLTRAETRQLLRTVRSGRFRAVLLLIYHLLTVTVPAELRQAFPFPSRTLSRLFRRQGRRTQVPLRLLQISRRTVRLRQHPPHLDTAHVLSPPYPLPHSRRGTE